MLKEKKIDLEMKIHFDQKVLKVGKTCQSWYNLLHETWTR